MARTQGRDRSFADVADALVEVADDYRMAQISIGLALAAGLVAVAVMVAVGSEPETVGLVSELVALPFALWFQVNLYRTMKGIGHTAPWAWNVASIALGIFCLFLGNLVFLAVFSTTVNGWFTGQQVKLGLLGPKAESLDARVRELRASGAAHAAEVYRPAAAAAAPQQPATSVEDFVRDGRARGMSDAEIARALTTAGWTPEQADTAIRGA